MKYALSLALFCAAAPAYAADLQYDPMGPMVDRWEAQTEFSTWTCIRDSETAALMQGDRDSSSVIAKAVGTCSTPAELFFGKYRKTPPEVTRKAVESIARRELDHLPGVSYPPPQPAVVPHQAPPPDYKKSETEEMRKLFDDAAQ